MQNTSERRGIVLAGGTGSRLWPITLGVSKQLLPIYDKPMIYYPLSVLMLAGIRDIAIITTPKDRGQFQRLLGEGDQWGVRFTYLVQAEPEGLAHAFILAENFLDGRPSVLVLGDNIHYGHGLTNLLRLAGKNNESSTIFAYQVVDPSRYGVVGYTKEGKVDSIVEKPKSPKSSYAVTGLYFVDSTASAKAKTLIPSSRGELEITSLLELYLEEGFLSVQKMGRGYAWFDTGTHGSLLEAGNYVRTLQKRQGIFIGSPDEVAYANGWIDSDKIAHTAELYGKSDYGEILNGLLKG
ncbi:MAG: glucose-1-phosphate thymidylyltransferase RfbA [Gammaproteobacteria bacterium]